MHHIFRNCNKELEDHIKNRVARGEQLVLASCKLHTVRFSEENQRPTAIAVCVIFVWTCGKIRYAHVGAISRLCKRQKCSPNSGKQRREFFFSAQSISIRGKIGFTQGLSERLDRETACLSFVFVCV